MSAPTDGYGASRQTWSQHAVSAARLMGLLQALHRSRSAPREEAAARRHIERMSGSPTRTAAVAASRESILDSQQQQMYGSWQRQQQLRQSGGNVRGSAAFASPSARKVCLTCPPVQLLSCFPPSTSIKSPFTVIGWSTSQLMVAFQPVASLCGAVCDQQCLCNNKT
jgi:hypothetical protein